MIWEIKEKYDKIRIEVGKNRVYMMSGVTILNVVVIVAWNTIMKDISFGVLVVGVSCKIVREIIEEDKDK